MKTRLITLIAAASLATGCSADSEQPPCGEGAVMQADGSCAVADDVCGAGTVMQDGVCVPEPTDTVGGGDTLADTAGNGDTFITDDVPVVPPDGFDTVQGDAICSPNCEDQGRECGDDGCGGSCGTCDAGTCNSYGICVDPAWTCTADQFGSGLACDCGCGTGDPDCGQGSLLETRGCGEGQVCQAGVCAACQPSCAGVGCGDDGCGGSCGKCLDPAAPFCFEGTCVDACVPNCDGHECGPDGCGETCGECGVGTHCVLDRCLELAPALSCQGQCGQVTSGGCSCQTGCTAGSCCGDFESVCPCVPQCDGRRCGADGCGDVCGTCDGTDTCVAGACVANPCDPNPCTAHGSCSGGACVCNAGFAGTDCGTCADGFIGYPACRPDPCWNQACSHAGTCNPATGACTCDAGYAGAICNRCTDARATYPACDQPDLCLNTYCAGKGTCDPATGACRCASGFTGANCTECAAANPAEPWPSCDVPCAEHTQCDDGNGCTVDTCSPGTSRCINVSCARSQVVWNQLGTVPSQATQGAPFLFPIDSETSVSFFRSNDWPLSQFTPPVRDGSFESAILAGVRLGWVGDFPYLNLDTPGGEPTNQGSLTFDFGEPATARSGGSWRYVIGIGALAFNGTGPTTITSSRSLQELGRVDAFGTGIYAAFDGDKTLDAPAGDNTGLQFFAMPADADDIVLTIDDRGTVGPDTFGVWVGAVDIDVVTCRPDSQSGGNSCVEGFCGDGIHAGPDEGCDDGGNAPSDGCSANCQVEAGYTCAGAVRSTCSD